MTLSSSSTTLRADANYKIMHLVDLQMSCGCTHAIKQEKIYAKGQLKLIHIVFAILNSHIRVIYLRFVRNTYFYVAKQKNWKFLYWLFSSKKTVNKMTSVRKSYIFKISSKVGNFYQLKSLEISWLMLLSLISVDGFIKNNLYIWL